MVDHFFGEQKTTSNPSFAKNFSPQHKETQQFNIWTDFKRCLYSVADESPTPTTEPLSCPHQGWVNDILRAGTWPFAFALHKPSANPTIFRHSWPEWRYTQICWYHLISSDILKWNKQLPCQGTKDIPQQWLHLWFRFPRRLHLQELHRWFSRMPRVTVIHGTRQKHHTRNTSFARLFVKEKHVAKHTKNKTMLWNGSWFLRRWNEGIDGWPQLRQNTKNHIWQVGQRACALVAASKPQKCLHRDN